jgi:CheY-like chemotaxis protein
MATVLVVDDEFGIAELFEAILTEVGHRVLTAINGKHALEVLAEEHVDLIFLDYMMPVMTGAATLAALAANPVLQHIPVVLMSSMSEAQVAARCSGYTRFMRKPFRLAQVVILTEHLLREDGAPQSDRP